MTRMQMGANIPLAGAPLRASLRWTPGPGVPEIDLTALLLQADGRVGTDADFVFYNQPAHPSGAVRLADGALEVDLTAVPAAVQRIVLAASATGGTFGQVPGLELDLADRGSGAAVAVFAMSASTETAFVCAELYRREAQWKFRAVGQGYASGLAGLAADFGISTGDAAPTPPPVSPAPTPPPSAPAPPPVSPAPAPPASPPPAPRAAPTGSARGALDLDAPWPPR